MLRRLPAELVVRIQMNDGPLEPTIAGYKDDCLRHRVPPGEGAFDLDGFLDVVLDMFDERGVRPAWDLEVCNAAAQQRPAIEHVRACADGLRSVLDRVRRRRDAQAG